MWLAEVSDKMVFFRLLRVKQYSKNVFVFAALLFSTTLWHLGPLIATLEAVVAMSLVGSATYIANDLFDIRRDQAHPKKRLRPIASGAVGIPFAIGVAVACLILGLVIGFHVNPIVLIWLVGYLFLQATYNLFLKQVPIADVFVIATGFVLRVILGAVAIHAQLSGWILLCTASLALLLGFGKRRSEFVSQGLERSSTRESLKGYSLQALDAFVVCSAASALLCYGLYGIESPTAKQHSGLILTIPFVAFGIFRYLMLIFGDGDTGEPESVVFKDKQLAFTLALFIITSAVALTGLRVDLTN
jgi:4-hydroxybenzoate polyprenyltransferase